MAKKRRPKNRMQTSYVTREPLELDDDELEDELDSDEDAAESDEGDTDRLGIVCPHCGKALHGERRIVRETRRIAGGKLRRRRTCPSCLVDTWTTEQV